ncbi:hypothetical protein [Tepidiphilus margaritifer]|uniref:hypothetical protein n=1 Tax=Tepidiphilus margaritifer TaxID=203471 RepID=UPI0003FBDCB7|nr:hypothetical protein [Tepidiphilus margaritifer]
MNARHDASYKHLFSLPKVVQHLVEGCIPDDWMKRLDFAELDVPESYDLGEVTNFVKRGTLSIWVR